MQNKNLTAFFLSSIQSEFQGFPVRILYGGWATGYEVIGLSFLHRFMAFCNPKKLVTMRTGKGKP
jgi:hypothetical protein